MVTDLLTSVDDLKVEMTANPHSRYYSWEYCYKKFYDAKEKLKKGGILTPYDYLELAHYLAFYLASWGMYRGSSFLLNYDYRVHKKVVKQILDKKYSNLFAYYWDDSNSDFEDNLKLLFDEKDGLIIKIKNMYDSFRTEAKPKKVDTEISDTLITKVLLGTMGCIPAYDEFLKNAIKKGQSIYKCKGFVQKFGEKSFRALIKFYKDNKEVLEAKRLTLNLKVDPSLVYPQMKFLDMGLWQMGR